MLHSITVAKTYMCVLMLLTTCLTLVQCKALVTSSAVVVRTDNSNTHNADNNSRQFIFVKGAGQETSTPDFIRLVVMRFIYGLASTMGVEERLEGLFNGAFVPPNADEDFFGFGGIDDDVPDGSEFDEASISGIFDDDVF